MIICDICYGNFGNRGAAYQHVKKSHPEQDEPEEVLVEGEGDAGTNGDVETVNGGADAVAVDEKLATAFEQAEPHSTERAKVILQACEEYPTLNRQEDIAEKLDTTSGTIHRTLENQLDGYNGWRDDRERFVNNGPDYLAETLSTQADADRGKTSKLDYDILTDEECTDDIGGALARAMDTIDHTLVDVQNSQFADDIERHLRRAEGEISQARQLRRAEIAMEMVEGDNDD